MSEIKDFKEDYRDSFKKLALALVAFCIAGSFLIAVTYEDTKSPKADSIQGSNRFRREVLVGEEFFYSNGVSLTFCGSKTSGQFIVKKFISGRRLGCALYFPMRPGLVIDVGRGEINVESVTEEKLTITFERS